MNFPKPPGVPYPPKNPHCNGAEPAQFSIDLMDILHSFKSLNKTEVLIGLMLVLGLIGFLFLVNELTRNKDMQNTKPKVKITLDEVNKLNEIYNEVKPKYK